MRNFTRDCKNSQLRYESYYKLTCGNGTGLFRVETALGFIVFAFLNRKN